MIQFLYGTFGSGKTHKILQMLREDHFHHIHSFLIVPEQQVVLTERLLLQELPPASQLDVEVLSFSRLYNRVCREYGNLQYRYITPPLKSLMMWKTLRDLNPLLEQLVTQNSKTATLSDSLLASVGEFKTCAITPHALERAASKMDKDCSLSKKLRDLALIYAAYDGFVSEKFSDSADDLMRLYDVLCQHDFFTGTHVYIDGFTSYTATEHNIIERMMAGANNVTISIPLAEPHEKTVYSSAVLNSEKRLIRDADLRGGFENLILPRRVSSNSAAITYLQNNFWNFAASTYDEVSDDIVLEACKNTYEESEAVARWILHYIRQKAEKPYRFRDFLVVIRDAENYRGILDRALAQSNIPFYFAPKSDLCSAPLIKFILSSLYILQYGWQPKDVIQHLKTGMYDIAQRDLDLFENYVSTWNIRGRAFYDGQPWSMNPDGYTDTISPRGEEILSAANRVRDLLCSALSTLHQALKKSETISEMCKAMYHFLEHANVHERLLQLATREAAAGQAKEAEEISSLYDLTVDALAAMAQAMEQEEVDIAQFAEILEMLFSKTEIGTIPTSVDQVVVGSASMIRANHPRVVILMGLCEGEFPATPMEDILLNSSDRTRLSELGIELSTDTQTQMSNEFLYIQKAVCLPSDKLIMTYPRADINGKAKYPSLPFTRTKKLFSNLEVHEFDPTDMDYLLPSLQVYSQYDPNTKLANQMISDTDACITPNTAQELYGNSIRLTQSRLEKYLRCHFSYYCTYMLSLRREGAAKFREAEIGTFIHYILEHLLRTVVDENGVREDVNIDEIFAMIDQIVEDYLSLVCPSAERKTGKIRHLCARLTTLSRLLVKNLMDEFSQSDFRPAGYEVKTDGVGNNPEPLIFSLKDGTQVSMYGVIDRVDLYRKDEQVFIRVVDYKTGTKEFSLEDVRLGLNIQMLLYLFALCQPKKNGTPTPIPAGVIYLSSNLPELELENYADDSDIAQRLEKGLARNGLLIHDEELLHSMNHDYSPAFLAGIKKKVNGEFTGKALITPDELLSLRDQISQTICEIAETMKRGDAAADPLIHNAFNPCIYCDMRPICRKP